MQALHECPLIAKQKMIRQEKTDIPFRKGSNHPECKGGSQIAPTFEKHNFIMVNPRLCRGTITV